MDAESRTFSVRELMDERRSAEKEIERLRFQTCRIAQSFDLLAHLLHDCPERVALKDDSDAFFDGMPTTAAEIPGRDRVTLLVKDLRAAICRERAARLQLRDLGVDLAAIEDEVLQAKSRALRRPAIAGLTEKPKRQPVGFKSKPC